LLTVCSFALNGLTIRSDEFAGHHTQASVALSQNVTLNITIIVLRSPDKATGGFDGLRDHIVDESMLVVQASFFERSSVFPVAKT